MLQLQRGRYGNGAGMIFNSTQKVEISSEYIWYLWLKSFMHRTERWMMLYVCIVDPFYTYKELLEVFLIILKKNK